MSIKGLHIVITGGSSGIGYQLVQQLSEDNTCIVISSSAAKLEHLREQFPSIDTYALDLTDLKEVQSTCEDLVNQYPQIDLLINNAATQYLPRITSPDYDLNQVTKEINLNLVSIHYLIHGLLPSLRKAKSGRIWNINSGLAIAPKTDSATYCATKAALYSLTLSLDYQLADQGIRVCQAILPLVDTPMTLGRGKNKMSPQEAASQIIQGIVSDQSICYIGKAKLLALVFRLSPRTARKIMRSY